MTILALAYGAGLLSTVNPCGFALLPAYMAVSLSSGGAGRGVSPSARLLRGVAVGLVVAAGFAAVFIAAAIVLSAGLRQVMGAFSWAGLAAGAALSALGIVILAGRHIGLPIPVHFDRERGSGYGRILLFGVAYAAASLACALPVLLAVVGQALAANSALHVLAVLGAHAIGTATILVALAVAGALTRDAVAHGIQRVLPLVDRLGGVLVLASGLYLVAYWLPQVLRPGSLAPDEVAGPTERFSALATAFLSAHEGAFAILGGLLLIGGPAMAGAARLRGGHSQPAGRQATSATQHAAGTSAGSIRA